MNIGMQESKGMKEETRESYWRTSEQVAEGEKERN